ncbi:MAG: LytR family transcriptional regulator [Clostridia bacterium]|nr:MAG: LytR family transcriptional regulator [Clostridia bacterium]
MGENVMHPDPMQPTAVPRRKKKRRLHVLHLVLLSLVVFLGFGYLGFYLAGNFHGPGAFMAFNPLPAILKKEPVNILLLGVDQRGKEPSRADTILVAFVDPSVPQVNLLSIPRDTYVNVPGVGMTKVNHAHAYGGSELTMEAVEALLGVPVDRYVEVNFEGFAKIIDILGGIEIDVDRRMHYPPEGIDLQPGRQVLDGKDALAFVRFRGYPEADIERIEHQHQFLLALADQTLRARNIIRLPELVAELRNNVRTNMDLTEVVSLAQSLKDMPPGNMAARTLPGEPRYIREVSYWVPDTEKLKPVVQQLASPPERQALGQEASK